MNDGAGWGLAGTKRLHEAVPDPITHVHMPTCRSCWAALDYSKCAFPWQHGVPVPWPCRGHSMGGRAQSTVLFLCSPPACSPFFSERNTTVALRYLILGFFNLSYFMFCLLKAQDTRSFFICFCFLDAGSHLPGAPSILPRHGRTTVPKPRGMNKTYPRCLIDMGTWA